MKLRCPACGAEGSLEEFSQAADLLNLSKAAAAFGEDWPLGLEYLNCFRGQPGRALQAKKLLRLARELWQMWGQGRFEFNRQWYRVGREEFREALRNTCNQVGHGLTNHNYLKKVLLAAAEKTSQREERELREREEGLRTGMRTTGEAPVLQEDPEWRATAVELSRAVRRARTPEAKAAAQKAYQEHMAGGTDGAEKT